MLLLYFYNTEEIKAIRIVYDLGDGSESNHQKLVFKRFSRNIKLFGKDRYLNLLRVLEERHVIHNVSKVSTVANIGADIM